MSGRRIRTLLVTVLAVAGLAACDPPPPVPDPGGYELLYPDVGIEANYTMRLSTDGYGWQFLVDDVAEVAAQTSAATGASIVVGPNVTGTTAAPGEIVVSTTASGCPADAYGCALPNVVEGRIRSAVVNVQPGYVDSPLTRGIVLHEVGHALGLDHYTNFFEGHVQIMHSHAIADATTYRSGDINGFARVAANGFASDIPGAPGSPTDVRGTGLYGSANVTWAAPASTGDSSIAAYIVTAHPGGATCWTTGALSCDVRGLAGGQYYTFTARALNVAGLSPASGHSPSVYVNPALEPSAPTAVNAVPGNASATVSWNAAVSADFPITGYTVTASPGGATCSTTGALACTVSGLANGTPYTFTVTAANGWGNGPASAPSASVTPVGTATFIARYDAATCQTLQTIADAMGGTKTDVIRVGVNAFADIAESGGAVTLTPPVNTGICEVPVTAPLSEVQRLNDTAAAWGVNVNQLHRLGGEVVIAIIVAYLLGG